MLWKVTCTTSMSVRAAARGLILNDVDEGDRAWPVAASDWWLFQTMAAGERDQRVELERDESPKAHRAWSAFWFVQETMGNGGDSAIQLVLALLDKAPDDQGVATVGAGPLEDLVNDHGADLVDLIERTARQSPLFAAALGSVWVEGRPLLAEAVDRLSRWLPAT
jgi:hypothetical protein